MTNCGMDVPLTPPDSASPAFYRLNAEITRCLNDVLVLMERFEATGMAAVMKEDYLALYAIYNGLQEQKETIAALDVAASTSS